MDCAGGVDFGLAVQTLVVVATLFRVLGWIGDKGVESDRRKFRFDSGREAFSVGLRGVDGGFAASVSAFNAELITCVARTVLSLALSCSRCEFAFFVAVAVLDFAVAVDFVGRVADEGAEDEQDESDSTRRSSLRLTTVAGVHVVVEEIAALTASEEACNEAMGILFCAWRAW